METVAVGVDGNVSFISGHNAVFDSFELMVGQRLVSTTGFGDTFEKVRGGLKYGSWTCAGKPKYDNSSSQPNLDGISGSGGAITLTVATGCTYTFTGVIERGGVSSDVNGGARLVYSGVTSGAIVEAWDETSGT